MSTSYKLGMKLITTLFTDKSSGFVQLLLQYISILGYVLFYFVFRIDYTLVISLFMRT